MGDIIRSSDTVFGDGEGEGGGGEEGGVDPLSQLAISESEDLMMKIDFVEARMLNRTAGGCHASWHASWLYHACMQASWRSHAS